MIRLLCALFLALLLCGCGPKEPVSTTETEPAPASSGYYVPGSNAERQTSGAIRACPLDLPDAYGMRILGEDLLVLSRDGTTVLTVLTGDSLTPAASMQLSFLLNEDELYSYGEDILFFDPDAREIKMLDRNLNVINTLAVPDDLVGTPVLSQDRTALYYCTADALRAWDLDSGIRRCVKEMDHESQSVRALHCNDNILECTIQDGDIIRHLFLSSEDGSLLHQHDGEIDLQTRGEAFYAAFPSGAVQALAFGEASVSALTPEDLFSRTFFLPAQHAAVSVSFPSEGLLRLSYYDLESGIQKACAQWDTAYGPKDIQSSQNHIYLLGFDENDNQDVIYRWDPELQSPADGICHIGPYHSRENPDTEGLARCQTYANVIGQQHGIQIKIGKDAAAVQPWDYDLEAEFLVPLLEYQLHQLEKWLSHYPDSMLADTASHFSSLTICLVRSIHGSPESGSLDKANGIQFFDDGDAYVALCPGPGAQQALYHELFHVMETHIWVFGNSLDRWLELNPSGFRYDYSYITNKTRDSGVYLRGESRAFVDTYSMSFPKEDKARVMEYAMLPGQEALFRAPILQDKLQCLCQGLREAYGLEDSPEAFLWEQYLDK